MMTELNDSPYIRFNAILSQFLLVALSDGFRGYAKLLRQSENLSKKTRQCLYLQIADKHCLAIRQEPFL